MILIDHQKALYCQMYEITLDPILSLNASPMIAPPSEIGHAPVPYVSIHPQDTESQTRVSSIAAIRPVDVADPSSRLGTSFKLSLMRWTMACGSHG